MTRKKTIRHDDDSYIGIFNPKSIIGRLVLEIATTA